MDKIFLALMVAGGLVWHAMCIHYRSYDCGGEKHRVTAADFVL